MVIFISQAPILVVFLPVLVVVGLFEAMGLRARRNIQVLSAAALACLIAAALASSGHPNLASLLYATGITLSVMLALYALATARRGKQWLWFAGVLLACLATLAAGGAIRAALTQGSAETTATAVFALAFVPGVTALMYGLFAPDIPKERASM